MLIRCRFDFNLTDIRLALTEMSLKQCYLGGRECHQTAFVPPCTTRAFMCHLATTFAIAVNVNKNIFILSVSLRTSFSIILFQIQDSWNKAYYILWTSSLPAVLFRINKLHGLCVNRLPHIQYVMHCIIFEVRWKSVRACSW